MSSAYFLFSISFLCVQSSLHRDTGHCPSAQWPALRPVGRESKQVWGRPGKYLLLRTKQQTGQGRKPQEVSPSRTPGGLVLRKPWKSRSPVAPARKIKATEAGPEGEAGHHDPRTSGSLALGSVRRSRSQGVAFHETPGGLVLRQSRPRKPQGDPGRSRRQNQRGKEKLERHDPGRRLQAGRGSGSSLGEREGTHFQERTSRAAETGAGGRCGAPRSESPCQSCPRRRPEVTFSGILTP